MTQVGAGGRGAWIALVLGICLLGALEILVLHFVAAAFLPPTAALVVDLVVGIPTLGVLIAFASPLWTNHRVDAERLHLRCGWLAALEVSRENVSSVSTYTPTARNPAQTGLDYDADTQLLSLVRSPSSEFVRVELREPVVARTQGWRRVPVSAAVVSVDDAAALVAACGYADYQRLSTAPSGIGTWLQMDDDIDFTIDETGLGTDPTASE